MKLVFVLTETEDFGYELWWSNNRVTCPGNVWPTKTHGHYCLIDSHFLSHCNCRVSYCDVALVSWTGQKLDSLLKTRSHWYWLLELVWTGSVLSMLTPDPGNSDLFFWGFYYVPITCQCYWIWGGVLNETATVPATMATAVLTVTVTAQWTMSLHFCGMAQDSYLNSSGQRKRSEHLIALFLIVGCTFAW